jgi:hypothetical protein
VEKPKQAKKAAPEKATHERTAKADLIAQHLAESFGLGVAAPVKIVSKPQATANAKPVVEKPKQVKKAAPEKAATKPAEPAAKHAAKPAAKKPPYVISGGKIMPQKTKAEVDAAVAAAVTAAGPLTPKQLRKLKARERLEQLGFGAAAARCTIVQCLLGAVRLMPCTPGVGRQAHGCAGRVQLGRGRGGGPAAGGGAEGEGDQERDHQASGRKEAEAGGEVPQAGRQANRCTVITITLSTNFTDRNDKFGVIKFLGSFRKTIESPHDSNDVTATRPADVAPTRLTDRCGGWVLGRILPKYDRVHLYICTPRYCNTAVSL